jgi:hypothetical protein
MILVNRPFFTPRQNSHTIRASDMSSCRDACRHAADSIARLLRIFDRLYTLRRINVQAVHLIFTASLIHVYNAYGSPTGDVRDAAVDHLEICCYALREMGQQFKNAIRALEVTIYLKGELLKRWHANNKRPKSPTDQQARDMGSPKRQRLSVDGDNGVRSSMGETLGHSPVSDLDYLNIGEQSSFGINLEDSFHLDSLFWADFTTIDIPHNTNQS